MIQLKPAGHPCSRIGLQVATPDGHACPTQPGGSVGLPTQSSHVSQELRHAATCVQGLHLVGSLSVALLQLPVPGGFSEPSQTVVGAPGMAQHPKQSQPFGVRGPQ